MRGIEAAAPKAAASLADEMRLLSREDLTDAPEVTEAQAAANRVSGKGLRKPRPARRGLLGVSEATFDRMVANGEFPKPIRLGPRMVRWPTHVVRGWIEQRCRAVTGDK